eukprot:gnl/TRDRNA2_/TRDRNA2_197116_c0_seq1.p1 gnl/TRDRNA2_/TRDRNA2_197116_c0~~gnl/TRDRNA2_/TRDRNA2_197116_c0_seq1.p1  ORF type:complete len:220 (+),score=44.97 gnl/TRDRNA2_/TRDRNA2_197116_c0_seq1:76-735(+)
MPADAPPAIEGFDINSYYQATPDAATKDYIMQQTMIRVKNPKTSLDFYTKVLGFDLIFHGDHPQWGFSVYFVAYNLPPEIKAKCMDGSITREEKFATCLKTPGCVELTWNHGSEGNEEKVYNTGNADTTGTADGQKVKGGFGHLGITVPDVYEACQRFKDLGCEFHKSPNSGGMKGLAFVKDPDGYLVEVLPQGAFVQKDIDCCGVPLEGGEGYKDNSK